MLSFDSSDPFPLSDAPYSEQQAHSQLVDRWLGLRTAEVETNLAAAGRAAASRDERYWIGLPTEALLTPYSEIRFMLERIPAAKSIVDLGAGYGRMGFVIERHFPSVDFLGIEVVAERAAEGSQALRRFGARGSLVAGDLTKMELPSADTYFLYDYGSRSAIEKTLHDLRERSLREPITVIGRGGATRSLIERTHLWLSAVVPPEHFPHFSIYRTAR